MHDEDGQAMHLSLHIQKRHLAGPRVQRLLHSRRLQAVVSNK